MGKETDKKLKGWERILAILAGWSLFIVFVYLFYQEIVEAGLNGAIMPIF